MSEVDSKKRKAEEVQEEGGKEDITKKIRDDSIPVDNLEDESTVEQLKEDTAGTEEDGEISKEAEDSKSSAEQPTEETKDVEEGAETSENAEDSKLTVEQVENETKELEKGAESNEQVEGSKDDTPPVSEPAKESEGEEAEKSSVPVEESRNEKQDNILSNNVTDVVPADHTKVEKDEKKVNEPSVHVPTSAQEKIEHLVSTLPPGVPMAPGVPLDFAPQTSNENASVQESADEILTETEEVGVDFVGRIIGKGGEQIRDLQARADCKVDVDQSGPPGAPKVITYQGTRSKIDFAKNLVRIICSHRSGMGQIELPLGYATKKQLQVPSTVIGKIIGRSGDMIKLLQVKSQCKIQVDHTQGNDPTAPRSVTIVGNPDAVIRAEEMVNIIIANPQADASNTIDLLIREKNQGASKWGSGPPYSTMPNGGRDMMGSVNASSVNQGYAPSQSQGHYSQTFGHSSQSYSSGHSSSTETDVFYSSKMYMGRIIGSKGVTINDLQKQSGCDIQINQNVPQGRDCEITIKGSRKGIERAKQMLNDIISMGPNHPYAGGQGGGNTGYSSQQYGGTSYSNPVAYETQPYQPQQQHYAQPFGQMQPQIQQPNFTNYQQPYGHQQFVIPQQQPVVQQSYQPQPYGGYNQQNPQIQTQPSIQYGSTSAYYGSQPSYQSHNIVSVSDWKSATTPEGQTYYYNSKTGETTWEKPPGMY